VQSFEEFKTEAHLPVQNKPVKEAMTAVLMVGGACVGC